MDYRQAATESYGIAFDARELMHGYFPLPPTHDCLLYVLTELGEHVRALLHESRPLDKRNRKELDHGAKQEWGDIGFMIASAGISSGIDMPWSCEFDMTRDKVSMWDFVSTIVDSGWECEVNKGKIPDLWLDIMMAHWAKYAIEHEWSPVELIQNTCDKLVERWYPLDPGVRVMPLEDDDDDK